MHFINIKFFILFTINLIMAQQPPANPCPRIFRYVYNGRKWLGYITIARIQTGETLLDVNLAVETKLRSDYVGKIHILSKNQQPNEPAVYIVNFPIQNPLPKIMEITVNGNTVCSGSAPEADYVTNIYLRNQLKLNEGGVASSTNIQPILKTQDILQPTRITPTRRNRGSLDNICGKAIKVRPLALITNGEIIPEGSWPWLVGIFKRSDNKHFCCGTLVSTRTIITSAHCFKYYQNSLNANDIYIVLGIHHISRVSEGVTSYVSKIVIHPDWTGKSENRDADIALVILQQSVQFTTKIIPACIVPSSINIPINEPTLVGWGKDENGVLSDVPKKIVTKIISEKKCIRSHPVFRQITSERTMCVGQKNGESPCAGDSGSGLLSKYNKQWYLYGIVSAALAADLKDRCDAYEFSVFTDVTKFDDFIKANMIY